MNKMQRAKTRRKIEGYNLILNLAWSFIFLFPLVVFCYSKMDRNWVYISLVISMATVFLPASFFNAIQLSKSLQFYQKAGIEFFNQFIQNGTLINRFAKNKFPGYKKFYNKEEAFKMLFTQSYLFEKFHFIFFIFFVETTIFAIRNKYYTWAVYLIIANIIYNFYPILLQQYIRLRLKKFSQQ